MTSRMRFPLLVAGVIIGCRDAAAPSGTTAEFTAINGALQAAVLPTGEIVCAGRGFGSSQNEGAVLVTTAGGTGSAEVLAWDNTTIRARLPADAVTGTVRIFARGDTLGPLDLFVRAQSPFDPATRGWNAGTDLPRALWGAGATALRYITPAGLTSLAVLHGGIDAGGIVHDSTFLATVDAAGVITRWDAAPDSIVPAPRYLHSLVGVDQTNATLELEAVAYMVGGLDTAGRVLPDVFGIGVTAAGEYGFWTPLAPLPGGRAGSATAAAFGTIIVIGGLGPDSLATTEVLTAVVNPNGTINGWFDGPPLPEGRAFASAVVHQQVLYVIGGEAGVVTPDSSDPAGVNLRSTIFRIALSGRSGFFADTAWTELPMTLLRPRTRHVSFVLGGAIVVAGGIYAGSPATGESEFAAIQVDGGLAPFMETGQTSVSDLGGGELSDLAAPATWDDRGRAVATLIGGRGANGQPRRAVWWH